MEMKRRDFFADGIRAALAALPLGLGGVEVAFADEREPRADVFVSLFLRGASDGLNFIPPLSGEDRKLYEDARPNLQMPLTGDAALLKLDDRFGFHPSAAPLLPLFKEKKLAVIHSAGLPADSRSHFDAQALMELGTPDRKTTGSGWLSRFIQTQKAPRPGPKEFDLRAVSVGTLIPTSYLGDPAAACIGQVGQLNLGGGPKVQEFEVGVLRKMYGGKGWLQQSGLQALETMERVHQNAPKEYVPQGAVDYGNSEIGNRMKTLAQLIKMGLGVQVAAVDMGGWDTHRFQGTGNEGRFAGLVKQLSQALAAFHKDLQGTAVTTVVMTEFGRRLKENANRGTDHGHGGFMLALGEQVNGGKVYGDWRGLRNENLYERADLAVTTDFRQVLAEALIRRMKNGKIDTIFPRYKGYKALGIFREV